MAAMRHLDASPAATFYRQCGPSVCTMTMLEREWPQNGKVLGHDLACLRLARGPMPEMYNFQGCRPHCLLWNTRSVAAAVLINLLCKARLGRTPPLGSAHLMAKHPGLAWQHR